MRATDPHHAEAAAACTAIGDFYGPGQLRAGQIVIVPEPFSLRPVKATVRHAHGHVVLVVTENGETLEYDIDEIQSF